MKLNPLKIFPVILILLLIFFWVLFTGQSKVIQPISYNHKIHIEEAGLECLDCHQYVESMPVATIPNITVCMDCHGEEPLSESPEEKKLIDFINKNEKIPWKQIYKVPDHVYFSHARHVVLGELDCAMCHGKITELTTPVTQPYLDPSMDNCINCHNKYKVSNDCLSCHL